MAIFSEFEAEVSAAVDDVFGDPIRIIPMVKGRLVSGSEDNSREPRTVVGVVDYNPELVTAKDKGQYDAFQPDAVGVRVHVSFDVGKLGAEDTWPRVGDRLKALSMPGQPVFRVSYVGARELSRVVFHCVPDEASAA